jgi:L-fuconolactonase
MDSSLTRRSCLRAFAAGACAILSRPSEAQSQAQGQAQSVAPLDTSKLPYIDAHSHVWSPDIERWPLAGKQTREALKPLSFTPEELLNLAAPERVGRVVLIQHSVYHLFDNSYLIDCARRYPGRFSLVGMLDDTAHRPGDTFRDLLPHGVRGLRITPRIRGKDWLAGPGMESLWKTAAQTGQAMCCLIDPSHLAEVAAMCERHPDTPVVIDHFARVGAEGEIRDADIKALANLAKQKRVTVKLSAYYALGKKQPPYEDLIPLIRRVLDAFTPERCMWASDAPYQVQPPHTYAASIALIRDHLPDLSPNDRAWILTKTAERVFFN